MIYLYFYLLSCAAVYVYFVLINEKSFRDVDSMSIIRGLIGTLVYPIVLLYLYWPDIKKFLKNEKKDG